ncbi:MAG: hypothetical protein ACLS2V_12740 [Clostridium paraputrificum]|uniref:hypothetical protein n=1 Tax=Clostridium sp. TaxID=1506 RepID=UPI0025B845CF|nr:hypothetical protein [Clostridium sp.]MBS5926129.1 hypothetical protein [Clostridium sp.]
MSIECLDNLVKNYDNIIRFPILSLYIKDEDLFMSNYIVIKEEYSLTICNRFNLEMVTINQFSTLIDIIPKKIKNIKKKKLKIFTFGKFELYKV